MRRTYIQAITRLFGDPTGEMGSGDMPAVTSLSRTAIALAWQGRERQNRAWQPKKEIWRLRQRLLLQQLMPRPQRLALEGAFCSV